MSYLGPRPDVRSASAGRRYDDLLARVEDYLPRDANGELLPGKDDVVHDLLAFLAEEMLAMNTERQREIKGFLVWLESYLGAGVQDLTPQYENPRLTTTWTSPGYAPCSRGTS